MTLHVLSIDQPYASLIMAGVKTAETRKGPPNGDMRPAGVRAGIGGHKINRGDRIGIASTVKRPRDGARFGPKTAVTFMEHLVHAPQGEPPRLMELCSEETIDLPLGHLLGTVHVDDCLPIIGLSTAPADMPAHHVWRYGDHLSVERQGMRETRPARDPWHHTDISDQLPYGYWEPGNWALLLSDPQPTTEVCPNDCQRFDGQVPGHTRGSNWPWVPCGVCNGDGRCPPVNLAGLPGTRQGVWGWTP